MSTLETTTQTYREALSLIHRGTKREDLKDNFLATLIFDKYNNSKDNNGKTNNKFDKKEWRAFQSFINLVKKREKKAEKISKNKKTAKEIKGLEFKLQESDKKLEELNKKWQLENGKDTFTKFLDIENKYEQKYKNSLQQSAPKNQWEHKTSWNDLTEKVYKQEENNSISELLRDIQDEKEAEKAVQNGAIKIDISAFGRGINIPGKESYEGIQKWAYITFPKEMPKEERDEFLNALSIALEDAKKLTNICEEINKEVDNRTQLEADLNDIYTGVKTSAGTSEQQTKSLETWQNNPIKQRIRTLEAEYTALWLKKERTKAEEERMTALHRQIEKLYETPYSGIYAFSMGGQNEIEGLNIEYEDSVVTKDHDNMGKENPLITNTHTGKFSWTKLGWKPWSLNLSLDFTKEEQYFKQKTVLEEGQTPQREFENHYEINPSLCYRYQDLSLSANSNINILPESLTQRNKVKLKYKGSGIRFDWNSITAKSKQENKQGVTEETKQTNHDTKITLSQSVGKSDISSSINWNDNEKARIYSISAAREVPILQKENWSLNASPSLKGSYLDRFASSVQHNSWRANGGITFSGGYNSEKFSANLFLAEDYTGTYANESKPQTDNSISVNLSLQKGKFGIDTMYSNYYNISSGQKSISNTGNITAKYETPIGTIRAGYTISKNKSIADSATEYTTGGYTLSLITNPSKWFKKGNKK